MLTSLNPKIEVLYRCQPIIGSNPYRQSCQTLYLETLNDLKKYFPKGEPIYSELIQVTPSTGIVPEYKIIPFPNISDLSSKLRSQKQVVLDVKLYSHKPFYKKKTIYWMTFHINPVIKKDHFLNDN